MYSARRAIPSGVTLGKRLEAVVFLAGAGTLAIEIAASRLLAPYFGSSTVVWANIIGLTLGFLALGYWLGGRLADRRPDPRVLARILLLAALALAVTPFAARPILRVAVSGLDALSVGSVVGSFFAALALFAVPMTALGAVSPFAVRLALANVRDAGKVAGRLYALSTLGSLVGTFVAALVAIPFVGTQRTLVGTAACLALGVALLAGRMWLAVPVVAAALLALPAGHIKHSLYETESQYQYIRVLQYDDGLRELQLNEGVATHSQWRRDAVLTGGYWDLFSVLPTLLDHSAARMLVIGNAGGTIARTYGRFYPQVEIDGVEIDPKVNDVARRYFGAGDNPRLHLITADGRPFLDRTNGKYDLIVVDAYRQPYVPFQLATQEFFATAVEHLRPGGAIALNVATTPNDHGLSEAVATTLLTAVPQVWRWRALEFNDVLVGLPQPVSRGKLVRRADSLRGRLRLLLPLLDRIKAARPSGRPLTDDRAPVEWLTDRMIFAQIARGGGLDDQLLPTAPR
jgi:spermidine synthase